MKKMIVTREEALKNGNSVANQEIKGEFVARHVYCNVNSLVEYCLSKGYEDSDSPVNIDSIENYSSYPEYRGEYADFDGGGENDINDEIDRLRDLQSDLYDQIEENPEKEEEIEAKRDKIEEEISELSQLEMETQEIYEWWAVSEYLYEKLQEQGYPVVDTGSCKVWGRTTTGQAILLDGVITRICADMGILDGQENSWAK
jgi:hypothetical protein